MEGRGAFGWLESHLGVVLDHPFTLLPSPHLGQTGSFRPLLRDLCPLRVPSFRITALIGVAFQEVGGKS